MVLDIIRIIAHNPYENKSIRMTKNHQPSKGEKGHSKGEKGESVRRLLRGKLQTKGFQQLSYHQKSFQVRIFNHQLTHGIK